jgi:hypothetical protein
MEDCTGDAGGRMRERAMQIQETILRRLGKALNVRFDDITHEPLPDRWVELIRHLNELERRHSERQPKPEPRQ